MKTEAGEDVGIARVGASDEAHAGPIHGPDDL